MVSTSLEISGQGSNNIDQLKTALKLSSFFYKKADEINQL